MTHPTHGGRPYRRLRQWVIDTYDHCSICGQPVDKTLSGRHPRGPTLEHTQPTSRGGPMLDKNNATLAHLGCNSRKKDRLNAPQQRRSRTW